MAKGRATLEWDQTALLWSQAANFNRDPEKQRQPFLPSDVHPYRTEADYTAPQKEKRPVSTDPIRVKVLKNVVLRNNSRQSIPPPVGG